jgi:hypothetical protein
VTDLSISRRSTSFSGSESIRAQLKDGHVLQGNDQNSADSSPVVQVLVSACGHNHRRLCRSTDWRACLACPGGGVVLHMSTLVSLLQGGVMQSPFGAPAPQPTVGSLTHSHSHSGLPPTVGDVPLPCGRWPMDILHCLWRMPQ